ncbi:MAG TPA: hypothetical protein VKH41_13250 [Myxococcota bacterium]|nr:hypothetical protein [Myxococcota bacterium]
MTHTAARRWLWLAALATMPVPYYIGQVEWAPVLRLALLTSLFGLVMLAEGGRSVILFSALGLLQTAIYTGLFFLAAGLVARGIARISEPPLRIAAVGTAVFLLFASSLLPIYQTPMSSTRMRSDLWHVFE